MEKERRKHPRCRLAGTDAFVLGRSSDNVAMLIDLSIGGIQLRYSPDQFTCGQWRTIDICIGKRNPLLIAGLTCEVVHDAACLIENGSYSGMDLRTCGVCFKGLTVLQMEGLGRFIASTTAESTLTT